MAAVQVGAALMADRCDLTDLLVDQCACQTHRGEPAPDAGIRSGGVVAKFPGICSGCGDRIAIGDLITAVDSGGWVHAICT